jgi:hypothetical protein
MDGALMRMAVLAGVGCVLLTAGWTAAADFDEAAPPWLNSSALDEAAMLTSDVLGAEDFSAEDDRPRIPEPLVFDLVRPLGAKRGEMEINTLALIPLNRQVRTSGIPDPIGLEVGPRPHPEWAPEIEIAIADGVAVEFELPFEDMTLAAYKAAGQVTFGTAFQERFIHGAQGIILYDQTSSWWQATALYIVGVRIDERWSVLGMFGLRTELNNDDIGERTERLLNCSLFYDLNDHITLGIESNWAQSLSGKGAVLLMPQVHWEITDFWMLQMGAGFDFSQASTLPECAVRLIRSF